MNDLVKETNLLVTNTHYQKKPGKLWTFISDMNEDQKSQVDYIMVNRKWRNTVKNCEAYSTFSSIGSDHRIVTAKLKLSLRTSKAPTVEKLDWSVLRNPAIGDRYTVEVSNRFEALLIEGETETERYQHFIDANKDAAKDIIHQIKKKEKKQASKDVRVQTARKLVQTTFNRYEDQATRTNCNMPKQNYKKHMMLPRKKNCPTCYNKLSP